MRRAQYDSRSNAQWVGIHVQFVRPVETRGGLTAHAGATGRIVRKWGGFNVEMAPCAHCGVSFQCKDVSIGSVEIMPGLCMYCGCTEENACDGGCSWITADQTICSASECVERYERDVAAGLLR